MKLFNTLTRRLESVTPLEGNTIKLYTCGLTVYSRPHIGNWVSYIYWDVLTRILQHSGFDVDRVQNITDVGHLTDDGDDGDDKMEKGAKAEGITAWQVADKYIAIAHKEAYDLLGLLEPRLIRATDCIDKQIDFVKALQAKGYTYVIPGLGVYFDTSKVKDYGFLARLDAEGLQAGARVNATGKKNITDFALWKFCPQDKKRDMQWESPWGLGFPGWHLECSAIAKGYLGDQIDIHTGGIDHIPVHHSNEIAQTEALTGKPFASIWVHNNHLKVNGGKMSKSLGNIYTLKDVTDKGYSLQAFKLLVLSKRYSTEGNFSWDIMEAADNRFKNWLHQAELTLQLPSAEDTLSVPLLTALQDNLDTPKALSLIEEFWTNLNKQHKSAPLSALMSIYNLLGINTHTIDITDEQKLLIISRAHARANKEWAKSDEIRDTLKEQGVNINDSNNEQTWSRQ